MNHHLFDMKKSHNKNKIHSKNEQTAETMGSLAVGMADNFNNILTTVMGACSLIVKDDPVNIELLKYVNLIRSSAERGAVLSDKLVHASEEGRHCSSANCSFSGSKLKNNQKYDKNDNP
ncbi:MAG: hypothetical protein PHN84_03880 [Desulfuromonadaceae bacterium]|nr:hypothetical protein [Desulfuromonadaceae bacterium]